MNIRQLVDWGLVSREHKKGDRKEYFTAETDVWEMFETIVRERRRREVEPIIETIDRCLKMVDEEMDSLDEPQRREAEIFRQRLENMGRFLSLINDLLNTMLDSGLRGLNDVRDAVAR
jgi:DNA-binding transcriptional regulator GbsR (MarR family)